MYDIIYIYICGRWVPLFFSPPLVTLPLSLRGVAPVDLAKVCV